MTRTSLFVAVFVAFVGSALARQSDARATRRAELESISIACREGRHSEVVQRSRTFLAGDPDHEERLAALSLLGTSLAGLERFGEAESTLAQARQQAPRDPVLACLQFNCHMASKNAYSPRTAQMAAEMGTLLAETAKHDVPLARELLFCMVDVFVAPKELAIAYQVAMTQASRKEPARGALRSAAYYFEHLRDGVHDLQAASEAVYDRRWSAASSAFWRVAVDVREASGGFPHEAEVLRSMMLAADSAAAALAGDFRRASAQASMAVQASGQGPMSLHSRTIANLVEPLRGSGLDESVERPTASEASPADPANTYHVPDSLRMAVDHQAFTTILNRW